MKAKIQKIGTNLGLILPKQIIEELDLKSGDVLQIKRLGSKLVLHHIDSEFEEWEKAYRELNTDYKDVLKTLGE